MISRLQPHDLELALYNVDSLAQARKQLVEIPKHGMLRGLIVLSLPVTDEQAARLLEAPFPTVLADSANSSLPSLRVDDRGGGEMSTNHLISLGHTRIGFIGEPPNNPYGSTSSTNREVGYRRAMHAAGIPIDPQLARYGAHVRSAGRQMAAELLSLPNPPTAIVASSDVQAMGCMEAAAAAGVRVPDDLSIVGYDDIEFASALGITTIRQPLERSGQRAAELIIEALSSGPRPPFLELMEVELVVRSTTAGLK
jgi:DNA-binding LacI/PurR family transcriptional regulator